MRDLLERSQLLHQLDLDYIDCEENKVKTLDRISDHILKTDMAYHFQMLENLIEIAEFNSQCLAAYGLSHSSSTPMLEPMSMDRASISHLTNGIQHHSPLSALSSHSPTTPKSAVDFFKSQFGVSTSLIVKENSSSSLASLVPLSKVIIKSGFTKEHLMVAILHAAGKNLHLF